MIPTRPTAPFRALGFDELAAQSAEFDACIALTPEIDHFCSSSDWILPAQIAFAPGATPFILSTPAGFIAMMALPVHGGLAAVPLEAGWGLAAPFAGHDPRALVESLAQAFGPSRLDALFISGLVPFGRWAQAITRAFRRPYRLGRGPSCVRRAASLEGGVDGFMGRRTASFRSNLRRARRRGAEAGLTFEYHGPQVGARQARGLYRRVIEIERTSWKGRDGEGIDEGSPCVFYQLLVERLADRRALRLVIARQGDEDVGYVFGGLFGQTYRGLQVSFREEARRLEVGNLMHLALIERLCAEGINSYDLGTDMEYKARWGESTMETVTLVVMRR